MLVYGLYASLSRWRAGFDSLARRTIKAHPANIVAVSLAPPWVGSRSPDGWDQIPRWAGGWVLHQSPWSFGFDSQTRGTRENRAVSAGLVDGAGYPARSWDVGFGDESPDNFTRDVLMGALIHLW